MADVPWRKAPSSSHRRGDLLCLALLLAGTASMFQLERGGQPRAAAPDLRVWRAEAADGTDLAPSPKGPAGIRLPVGGRLWLFDEDHALNRYDHVAFDLRADDATTGAELFLHWTRDAGHRVRLQFAPEVSGLLWARDGTRDPRRFASTTVREPTASPHPAIRRVAVHFAESAFAVSVDGDVLLEHEGAGGRDGRLELRPTGGDLDVLGLEASGRRTTQSGEFAPFEIRDPMRLASPPSALRAALVGGAGRLLALWIAGILFLRAVSARQARWAATVSAGLRFAAPACAVLLAGTLLRLPSTPTLAASVAPLGMVPAWRRLHATVGSPRAKSRRSALIPLATILMLCGGATWTTARKEHALLEQVAARERAVRTVESPPPFRLGEPLTLGPDNALVIPGPWTDARLVAIVALEPDAVLAARLRAPRATIAEGVLAVLPADPRLVASLCHEDPMDFWSFGGHADPLASGRDLELEILMRGRHFEVLLDGKRLLAAESLEPTAGHIVLLSNRGGIDVREARVEALAPVTAASPLAAAMGAALAPVAVLLGAALVATWRLRFGALTALHASAFGLLPLLALLLTLPPEAMPSASQLHAAALAGGVVLAVVPLTRWRERPTSAMLLAAASGTALTLTLNAALHPASEVSANLMSRLSYMDWPGDRLHEDLLHAEHPLFRRWNHYLARHTFRERHVSRAKPPDSTRVVVLGGSSSWGWRVPPGSRADYPAALEDLLSRPDGDGGDQAPSRWEVINAAFVGATSGRLFRMLRNVLVDFDPDIIVLSVFYNDAPALSQGDEEAYLARVTAPGYRRGWLDDWRERRARERESANLEAFMRGGLRRDDAARAWRASGATGWPPDRFAASLRRYAEFAKEHGVALVLVKEPIAGDGPFLWKDEFYAAIDELGARAGLSVVDPTPALQSAGGRQHFMDDVHLKPSGHLIVAETLEPVVRALAHAAGEAAAPGSGPDGR